MSLVFCRWVLCCVLRLVGVAFRCQEDSNADTAACCCYHSVSKLKRGLRCSTGFKSHTYRHCSNYVQNAQGYITHHTSHIRACIGGSWVFVISKKLSCTLVIPSPPTSMFGRWGPCHFLCWLGLVSSCVR